MTKKATTIMAIASLAMVSQMQGSDAFSPIAYKTGSRLSLHVEEPKVTEAVFGLSDADDDEEDIPLDKVEMLGRGAAKVSFGVELYIERRIKHYCLNYSNFSPPLIVI
jgi:hypothetical protein